MSSNGGTDGHPFRVTLDQQRLTDALVRELSGNNISVHAENGSWIVSIDGATTDQLVVTRSTPSGTPSPDSQARQSSSNSAGASM